MRYLNTVLVSSLHDLGPFGIQALTGEACGFTMRLLCDVTAKGKRIAMQWLGLPHDTPLRKAWNRGTAEDPHVGCLMLQGNQLQGLAVVAFAQANFQCAVILQNGDVMGVSRPETDEQRTEYHRIMDGLKMAPVEYTSIIEHTAKTMASAKKRFDDWTGGGMQDWLRLHRGSLEPTHPSYQASCDALLVKADELLRQYDRESDDAYWANAYAQCHARGQRFIMLADTSERNTHQMSGRTV